MMKSITYRSSGVDIDAGDRFVEIIKPLAKTTFRPGVISKIGNFAGLFAIGKGNYKEPVLVSSTDGVGTKLKIAFMMDVHDTVGIDLVAMNVNDIITLGAEPLFFLDYIAISKLDIKTTTEIIKGIVYGCKESGCALLGGETAEMPSFYKDGEYDLAGFVVGVAEKDKIIDGSAIKAGDHIIGLASSGLHSNGFSLARKIFFKILKLKTWGYIDEFRKPLGEELLTPTRIYAKSIAKIKKEFNLKGIAHITGGGLTGNIPRILPPGCSAGLKRNSWEIPPIFRVIQQKGAVTDEEMWRTFNNGIGLVLVVPASESTSLMRKLKALGEAPHIIGEIIKRKKKDTAVVFD